MGGKPSPAAEPHRLGGSLRAGALPPQRPLAADAACAAALCRVPPDAGMVGAPC